MPEEALAYDQRGSFVLVVDSHNIVRRAGVKAGGTLERMRVIDEGLDPNQWVVMKGLQKAIPGRPVTPERLPSGNPARATGQSGSSPPAIIQ